MQAIDGAGAGIALVVDDHALRGTVTDGDVRRGILRGLSLDASVIDVMNPAPVTARVDEPRERALQRMLHHKLRHMPVLDGEGRLVGLRVLDEMVRPTARENVAVVMAGGLGERMRPYTENIPKPMLLVGNQPILERVLRQLKRHGIEDVALSVNFRADVIEGYFQDGASWGMRLRYLHERARLGTAGALSLLPDRPTAPFFVMNADLLTEIDFTALLDFHTEENAALTMCVATHATQIPYGVVEVDGSRVSSIVEKPRTTHFINAGIYLLEPRCLDLVPQGEPFDMPTLIDALLARGEKVAGFPMRETWMDIGQLHDYQRAILHAMAHEVTP